LQDAVQGKLVEQNKNDEPASELLKKIKAEKEKLIAEKKLKKEKELPPIKPEEIPFEIPENWEWCRLGEEPNTDGVFALRCSDVRYRFIDLKNVRKVTQSISNQYSRTVLKGGEILLNVRGTLGGCAITEDTVKGFNIAREISLIVLQDTLLNDFVFNVLTSPFFNIEIGKKLRGIAYKGLNLNLLNSFLIPMPPLAEQTRIVQKLDELMQYCNELEASIKQSESQNEKLLQQVLREALRPKAIEEQQDSLSFAAEPQGNYKKQKAIR
jgi:type I restriction enzyme S subunit